MVLSQLTIDMGDEVKSQNTFLGNMVRTKEHFIIMLVSYSVYLEHTHRIMNLIQLVVYCRVV